MFQATFTVMIDGDQNEDRDVIDSIIDAINSHGIVVNAEVEL